MKFYQSFDNEAVTSAARAKTPSYIPPYDFLGEVEVGVSKMWSPPHSILLENGFVIADSVGTALAGWLIMKMEPFNPDGVLLGEVHLAADKTKAIFSFDNAMVPKVVHPADKLYVASLVASGHSNPLIQMHGWRL